MPFHTPTRGLPLAAVLACLLQPAPASLAGHCSATSMSCTGGSTEALDDDTDVARSLDLDDAASDDAMFSLLAGPMEKVGAGQQSDLARTEEGAEAASPEAGPTKFNCRAHPHMCEAPFNCHRPANTPEATAWAHGKAASGLAADGRPNLQAWCSFPTLGRYIHTCLVKKDLAKAARLQYEGSKAGKFGPNAYELDGSYCFIEGHCLNTRVSHSTTLEESSQMCDERYGRARWTSFGGPSSRDVLGLPAPRNKSNGFDGQENTAPFLVAGCAMGNYHCDVMYCRETYCKDEYMVQKYGHFLQGLGWTESTASWLHAAPPQGRRSLRGQRASVRV